MNKKQAAGAFGGAAAAAIAYPFVEARRPRLTRHELEVGAHVPALRILHVSDSHLHSSTDHLARWLSELPGRLPYEPDFVFGTGDFIENDSGIAMFLAAVERLPARRGHFYVLGSHDYYQAEAANYLKYFVNRPQRISTRPAATQQLEAGLKELGWRPLTNAAEIVDVDGAPVRIVGMDDPYLDRDDTSVLRRSPNDAAALALVHAPDVVSEAVLAGFDVVLAGHTHGGQVRIPMVGALVTNSRLPARLAAGPHRVGRSWLHVTPGVGTGKFTPVRFNCPPEVSLLELTPRDL